MGTGQYRASRTRGIRHGYCRFTPIYPSSDAPAMDHTQARTQLNHHRRHNATNPSAAISTTEPAGSTAAGPRPETAGNDRATRHRCPAPTPRTSVLAPRQGCGRARFAECDTPRSGTRHAGDRENFSDPRGASSANDLSRTLARAARDRDRIGRLTAMTGRTGSSSPNVPRSSPTRNRDRSTAYRNTSKCGMTCSDLEIRCSATHKSE